MHRIIFLDIDGVLATNECYNIRHNLSSYEYPAPYLWNKKCVKVFNEICEKTENLRIVLSSDWKIHFTIEEMDRIALANGLKFPIAEFTPKLIKKSFSESLESVRIREIKEWLKRNEQQGHWVAVDDMDLSELGKFAHCKNTGLGIRAPGIQEKMLNNLYSL